MVVLASAAVMAQYAWIVLGSLAYPFQLEWMEGGIVEVAERVRTGAPLYSAPSVDYVPYVYPPVYFVATAGVAAIVGPGLLAGRLVSLLATLATCALVARFVQRETRSWWLAVLGAALYVAFYEVGGRWLHLARVDSLYVALLVGGIYLLRFGEGRRSAIAAGAVMALCFFTKQTALVALVPVAVLAAFTRGRAGAWALGVFLGGALAGTVLLAAVTDGWFLYYAFELPAQHDLAPGEATEYLFRELPVVVPSMAVAVYALVTRWRSDGGRLHVAAAAGLWLSSWLSFVHTGGYLNVLLPMYASLAILVPLGLAPVVATDRWQRWVLVAAFVAAQLVTLTHPASESIPPDGAAESGDRFLAQVGALEGEVLMPDHRWLQTRVGKRSHGLGMAARDVLRADPDDRGRRMLEESLAHALTERRFAWILTSQPDWLGGALDLAYEPAGALEGAPLPLTGHPTRPRHLFRPRE